MKQISFLLGIILCSLTSFVSPTTVNGRFTISQVAGERISALLQINTDSGTDDLGGTTLVLNFDTTAIHFPTNPVKDIDYVFFNFDGGSYSLATVTEPVRNQIWVNIDLPYVNNNNGNNVAGSPDWTDVVTIYFDVVDSSVSPNLSWLTSSPFWGIYDANNSTIWGTGDFENYPTSIEPNPDSPVNFDLSQNFPNPFNPNTTIRFTISAAGGEHTVPVQLKVYDILGNEVATFVDEEKEPGVYEVEFSNNNAKINLASGTYIYRIKSQGVSITKKMVLLK